MRKFSTIFTAIICCFVLTAAAQSQSKFVAADGAKIDTVTKLPTRVVHKTSGIVFVLIPAGEFWMGSPETETEREKIERRHKRIIKRAFYLGETEVTVGQFRKFAEAAKYKTDAERGVQENDRTGTGAFASMPDGDREWNAQASWRNPFPYLSEYRINENHPVVQVSWNDAKSFADYFGMSLPTEAQWEYTARAGSETPFFWGAAEADGKGYGNFKDASGRKRFSRWNSSFAFDDGVAMLAEVSKYRSNAWKTYDIQGNAAEWTADVYRRDYPADGADESAVQGEANAARVIRGASWLDEPEFYRSAKRVIFSPQGRRDFIGFRVALTAESVK
jgi:formylglycine-generating enzyme